MGSGVKIEERKKYRTVGIEDWESCPVCRVECKGDQQRKAKGEKKFEDEENEFCGAFPQRTLDQ